MTSRNKTIIDVRTPEEFITGSADGSINIPLNEIQQHLEQIKQMEKPVVLCCASGGRSALATSYLRGAGIDCLNAGSWTDVKLS